jgi:putative intracellular protease/amidase
MTGDRDELREVVRRLLERDAAEQGIAPVCDDPATLAAVGRLLRPVPEREGGERRAAR